MKMLIVATSTTAPGVHEEIRAGKHHRIDYLELADRFDSQYVDYTGIAHAGFLRRAEEGLRLDFQLARRVAHVARTNNYDTVFSLSERVGIPLTFMLERQVKHVVHFHHPLSPKKLLLLMALRVPHRWSAMIVLTQQTANILRQKLGLDEMRVKFMHSPIDTKFYNPVALQAPRCAPRDHVLALGLSHRDYPTLIRAMRRLPHIPCDVRAGSMWVNGATVLDHKPLPRNITLKAFVHPAVLREVYAASRFVIVPIRRTTMWSAGCTTVTQAQAMGRPVIATRNPGMGDYVLDGETGLLVEQSDPASMADAIARLWNDPDLVARMGARAREWVAASFSLDQWLDQVTQLIHRLD